MLLSVVSPVYNGEGMVHELVTRVKKVCIENNLDYEIILVEDNSPDQSWLEIVQECKGNNKVKGVKLSKNFGQHYAISAGLTYATGEWTIVMDCDLQDRPEEIPALLNKAIDEGHEIVLAKRQLKKHRFIKRAFSNLFGQVLSYLTGFKYDNSIANFGVYHKKTIDTVVKMTESIRFFPVMIQWIGYKKGYLNVVHGERKIGNSSYNFHRLINLAIDIMLAYSDKPLRLTIKLGLFISGISFMVACSYLILYLKGTLSVPGYTSTIISLWFLSGLIILILGVIGLYIGKTFEGVKGRPIFIVADAINTSPDK